MATHSSILAWRIPMDRGTCRTTVHRVAENWTNDWSNLTWMWSCNSSTCITLPPPYSIHSFNYHIWQELYHVFHSYKIWEKDYLIKWSWSVFRGSSSSRSSVRNFRSNFASNMTHTFYHLFFSLMCIKKGLISHMGRLLNPSSKMFLCEVLYPLKFDISWIFINSNSWEIIT